MLVVVIDYFLFHFLKPLIGEVDDQHHDDGDDNQSKDNSTNDDFHVTSSF